MRYTVVLGLCTLIWVLLTGYVCCEKPSVVNIGSIFTFNSVIGRVAKPAMEAAVADVNADSGILNGTELKLFMKDSNCNAFLGSVEAFQVLEKEIVSIIGPQSSAVAHMLSEISNGLQVPLISYAATDPTLSALQFPYFIRTAQSDAYQMAAMADLIDFYDWKEVIAVFVDDDYGRNGISALGDELEKKKARIAFKLALPVQFNLTCIIDMFNKSKSFGPRVYVVHIGLDSMLSVFAVANELKMMTSNYVWFATDWLSTTIDSFSPMNQTSINVLEGVVTLRQHTPQSSRKRAFMTKWKNMQHEGLASSELNVYGLYAYDTVWAVAHSIENFINEYENISFSFYDKLLEMKPSDIQLSKIKIFDGGSLLRQKLLETNMSGLTGHVQFNQDRNVISGGYDIINIEKMGVHTVGFWSNRSGFSVTPPETLKMGTSSYSPMDQKLGNITWPGGDTVKPRGWVVADDEQPLRIGVPKRVSFIEFATVNNSHEIQGYCIDVFIEARKLVPYDIPYRFVPFGNGHSNPNYDELVKMVAENVIDAAVGDIAIVKNRTMIVDFSLPYATTGLVIVAPIMNSQPNAWVFLEPFTWELWCVTAASFVMVAVVIWALEHRVNNDFRGPPKRQLATMFLFSFSTLFKKNQEDTVSGLGRMVMVVWLFLLMVITSSYTANLTSILTVQQLSSSSITGIDSLIASNWPIGYQVGSFAYSYLTESLYISSSRLVPLGSPEEYERALRQGPDGGGVGALIDELTYMELFLSEQTDFGIIGQTFTRSGWGFAFQRDSPLAVDMSTAILKLSENGELQKIHKKWFCKMGCPGDKNKEIEPNHLHLISFWGLYLLCAAFCLTAFILFLLRMVYQFIRYRKQQANPPPLSPRTSNTHCAQVLHNFVDFIDEKEESIKKVFKHDNPETQVS